MVLVADRVAVVVLMQLPLADQEQLVKEMPAELEQLPVTLLLVAEAEPAQWAAMEIAAPP